MTTEEVPEILRPARVNLEVRFNFTFKGGGTGYISGTCTQMQRLQDGGYAIRVRIGGASRLPEGSPHKAGDEPLFDSRRMTPTEPTGLIVPVSRKEMANGTGAARHLRPSDPQVSYAISLRDREGVPGARNFCCPTDAEFRAMSRNEISEWIGMAKDELGI